MKRAKIKRELSKAFALLNVRRFQQERFWPVDWQRVYWDVLSGDQLRERVKLSCSNRGNFRFSAHTRVAFVIAFNQDDVKLTLVAAFQMSLATLLLIFRCSFRAFTMISSANAATKENLSALQHFLFSSSAHYNPSIISLAIGLRSASSSEFPRKHVKHV